MGIQSNQVEDLLPFVKLFILKGGLKSNHKQIKIYWNNFCKINICKF